MKFLILILALVALASPSFAAEIFWGDCTIDVNQDLVASTAPGGGLTTDGINVIIPGQVICIDMIDTTDTTDVVNAMQCDHVNITQYLDADGDGDNSTVTARIGLCPNMQGDPQGCDGATAWGAMTTTTTQGPIPAHRFRLHPSGTTDTAPLRWEVQCVGNAAK